MAFKKKKQISSILSIKKDEINILCDDLTLCEKINNILIVAEDNCYNNNWTREDLANFLKQFTKLEIDLFSEIYDQILYLLNLSIEDLKIELEYLDNKLQLQVFEDERCLEPVKEKVIENGKERERIVRQRTIYNPHTFSTADIIIFFQKLNSQINKHNNNIINLYQNKLNSYDSLRDKESEIELLIELLDKEDHELCNIMYEPYFKWFNCLDNNEMHPLE